MSSDPYGRSLVYSPCAAKDLWPRISAKRGDDVARQQPLHHVDTLALAKKGKGRLHGGMWIADPDEFESQCLRGRLPSESSFDSKDKGTNLKEP
jgi:hypothetical protein